MVSERIALGLNHGDYGGQRFSRSRQITAANAEAVDAAVDVPGRGRRILKRHRSCSTGRSSSRANNFA
jgi:hypothetical protein